MFFTIHLNYSQEILTIPSIDHHQLMTLNVYQEKGMFLFTTSMDNLNPESNGLYLIQNKTKKEGND